MQKLPHVMTIGRLYGRILKNRIEAIIHDAEELNGFRARKSCIYNGFCLKQLHEKAVNRAPVVYIAFTDLHKAYDSKAPATGLC